MVAATSRGTALFMTVALRQAHPVIHDGNPSFPVYIQNQLNREGVDSKKIDVPRRTTVLKKVIRTRTYMTTRYWTE